jgi:hypothetical protein
MILEAKDYVGEKISDNSGIFYFMEINTYEVW